MNIEIKVIPNHAHRPGISGADWYFDADGTLQVRVSKMTDERYELALMVHEVVEAILCRHNGVHVPTVDDYDMEFEAKNPDSKVEAGDQPDCPYAREHSLATAAERIVAAELGVKWKLYDEELNKL